MKLQFVVVETGERWRRALLRMVLDPKIISHNDYGSFHAPTETASLHHTLNVAEDFTDQLDNNEPPETSRLDGDMTRDQRQPLLPLTNGHQVDGWQKSASPTIEYFDDASLALEHRKGNEHQQLNGGAVQIDIPAPLREVQRFPKEKWKTFIAFMILVVSFLCTTTSLAMVHEQVPAEPPLPDIVLDNIDAQPWALNASEIIIMVSTTCTVVLLIFHKHKFIVMRRIFMILSLLYVMRSITMFVTVLPMADPTYKCSAKLNHTDAGIIAGRVWQLMIGFGLSINGKHTYCGDFIYSGHTVILVMCYLIMAEYSPKRLYVVHWLQLAASTCGIVFVLIARGHYTVDVLIAYYVTTTLFWAYHTLANNPALKHCSPSNFLARHWWFLLFVYFEKNVDGVVPRLYEWPLPWPRRCIAKHPNRNS